LLEGVYSPKIKVNIESEIRITRVCIVNKKLNKKPITMSKPRVFVENQDF